MKSLATDYTDYLKGSFEWLFGSVDCSSSEFFVGTTEAKSCGQQEPLFVSLKGVLRRSLVGGSRGLCDVANVVLEEFPITSAFHPDVRAAVSRLAVDTAAVRHDR